METYSEATERKYKSPPTIASELGVSPDKVLGWIRAGELRAVDLASRRGGRPRYRVAQADLDRFLLSRSATPKPKTPRARRRVADGVVSFI